MMLLPGPSDPICSENVNRICRREIDRGSLLVFAMHLTLRRKFKGVIDDLTFEQTQENEGSISATLKITDDEDARAPLDASSIFILPSAASCGSRHKP